MSHRLVDDRDAVAVLAEQVADRTGIPASHIEKDFWVTEVLRGAVAVATASNLEIVFKGGTSLSKAFGLIERFSEDVDLLVVIPGSLGTGAADSKLKALVGGAATATGLTAETVANATSKGVKRDARFHYRESDAGSALSAGVFLEIGSRGGAMPATLMSVTSILSQHAATELEDCAESEPVRVRVLDPCRTLVEKLVLLHTAHTSTDPHDAIRGARHYYDVHQLLANPAVVAAMNVIGIETLTRDVYTYSTAAGLPADPRPAGGFANSPAFTNGQHLAAARERYGQSVLGQLLWPHAAKPSFDSCLNAVRQARTDL